MTRHKPNRLNLPVGRWVHLFTILVILSTSVFYACGKAPSSKEQNPQQALFNKANKLYKKGEFRQAMNVYKEIENKSPYVHYNLGNCAYRLKKYGKALLYWRRAEKHWGFFNRGELIDNITLLKEKVRAKTTVSGLKRGPILIACIKLKNHLLSLIRSIPLIFLQLCFLLLWLYIFIYIRFLYKKRKNYTILTLFALMAIFGIVLIVRYVSEIRSYGVVTSKQTQLLSGPAKNFTKLLLLPEAQEVIIKKESGNYYKVKTLKRTGWVNKKDVKKI